MERLKLIIEMLIKVWAIFIVLLAIVTIPINLTFHWLARIWARFSPSEAGEIVPVFWWLFIALTGITIVIVGLKAVTGDYDSELRDRILREALDSEQDPEFLDPEEIR